MKLFLIYNCFLFLIIIPLIINNNNYYQINCEQLSTVFVLETSDSDSDGSGTNGEVNLSLPKVPLAEKLTNEHNDNNDNTKVITDNSEEHLPATSNNNQPSQQQQQQQQPKQYNQNQSHDNNSNKSKVIIHVSDNNNKNIRSTSASPSIASSQQAAQQQRPTVRRQEETSNLTPTHPQQLQQNGFNNNNQHQAVATSSQQDHHVKPTIRSTQQQQQQQPVAHTNNNNKLKQSTSSSHDEESSSSPNGTAKNDENRLLIEITSDDDDPTYNVKPPKKINALDVDTSSSSQSIGINNNSGSSAPKRTKPSINIVISTAGNNKNNNKPMISIIPADIGSSISNVGSITNENNNNNAFIHNNNPTSSTYRPVYVVNTNTNTNNNNDPYQPSVNVPLTNGYNEADETPIKPNPNDYYESTKRPTTLRPNKQQQIAPVTYQPVVSNDNYNNNNNNQYNNNNNNNVQNQNIQKEAQGASNSLYPLNEKNCGLQFEKTRIVGGDEANPDDFLWMAAIIKSKPNSETEIRPFCGGSLITRRHILTAAHCLENLAPRDVLVRLGSYDFDDATASSLSADYAIDQFRVPATYNKKTHVSDIAIMRLKTPLSPTDNYKTVCMPQARRAYVGAQGIVIGYGSQSESFRKASPKLRQVTVPIWENRRCSQMYKRNMTDNFLCAGYEEGGKDACQGDSGGPLMTMGPGEKMLQIALVSYGFGCARPEFPGVYTRVSHYLDWIERNTRE